VGFVAGDWGWVGLGRRQSRVWVGISVWVGLGRSRSRGLGWVGSLPKRGLGWNLCLREL
jgi:hypothetical protein